MKHCFEGVRGTTFANTSNFHAADHTAEIARLFVVPKLASCSRGEAKHCAIRAVNKHSNHRYEEFDMLVSQNVRQAITFLANGGAKHLHDAGSLYTPEILFLLEHDKTLQRLVSLAGVNDTYVGHDNDEGFDDNVQDVASVSGPLRIDGRFEYFSKATIPHRQAFAARARVGGFFACAFSGESGERLARLESIQRNTAGEITITLLTLEDTGTHTCRGLSLYTTGQPRNGPLHCILQPVHIYPSCMPGSACTIPPVRPMPHHFAVPCTALNGDHVPTQFFIHNTYLVK
jgi:hypothetical protein